MSPHLLSIGARVTALDISPGMTAIAARRIEAFQPEASCAFQVAPIEDSGLPDESFDVVVGRSFCTMST